MKFKCAKDDLVNAVLAVEKAVAVRSTLPIIGNILIEAEENGLKFSANDLEMGIEMVIDAAISEKGSILAPAKTISGIVTKLPDGEVNVETEKNNQIKIVCGRSKFNIHGLATDEFPMLQKINTGIDLRIEAEELKEMIKQTIIAVSFDESKHVLNGIYVEVDESEIKFIATDGYRLAKRIATLKEKTKEGIQVIVPTKAMMEISKVLTQEDFHGAVDITITKDHIAFNFDKVYLIVRLIQGKFPDYKQVVPAATKTEITMSRKDLFEAAERASIIASSSANIIKIETVDEKLLITANTANVGDASELLDIKIDGEKDIKIAFNVRLIMDVLKNIDEDNITLSLNSSLSPGLVKPKEDNEYIYVIMPIRTAEVATPAPAATATA